MIQIIYTNSLSTKPFTIYAIYTTIYTKDLQNDILFKLNDQLYWSIFCFKIFKCGHNDIFGCFEYLPSDYDLVEDAVNFMKVEDDIQLADISEVVIQIFNKHMNKLSIGMAYLQV